MLAFRLGCCTARSLGMVLKELSSEYKYRVYSWTRDRFDVERSLAHARSFDDSTALSTAAQARSPGGKQVDGRRVKRG